MYKIYTHLWQNDKLKNSSLLCALALAHHIHRNRGYAWPSVERLSRYIRKSVRQTQRLLRQLEAGGVITIDYCTGPHGVNRYRFIIRGDMSQQRGDMQGQRTFLEEQREKEKRAFTRGLGFLTPGSVAYQAAVG